MAEIEVFSVDANGDRLQMRITYQVVKVAADGAFVRLMGEARQMITAEFLDDVDPAIVRDMVGREAMRLWSSRPDAPTTTRPAPAPAAE